MKSSRDNNGMHKPHNFGSESLNLHFVWSWDNFRFRCRGERVRFRTGYGGSFSWSRYMTLKDIFRRYFFEDRKLTHKLQSPVFSRVVLDQPDKTSTKLGTNQWKSCSADFGLFSSELSQEQDTSLIWKTSISLIVKSITPVKTAVPSKPLIYQSIVAHKIVSRQNIGWQTENWQPEHFAFVSHPPLWIRKQCSDSIARYSWNQSVKKSRGSQVLNNKTAWNWFNRIPTHKWWWFGRSANKSDRRFPQSTLISWSA
jgi:hypothetical protein